MTWLLGHLHRRSFGIVLLLLGVGGLIPIVSTAAGLIMAIPAYQMIRARPTPRFPRRVADRPVSTDKVKVMLGRVVPVLRYLERFIKPRWVTPFETTKRVIGVFVLMLGVCQLTPIPLSNIPIGLATILIAFAYLEEDGALLALGLVVSAGLFSGAVVMLWGTVSAMIWLAR